MNARTAPFAGRSLTTAAAARNYRGRRRTLESSFVLARSECALAAILLKAIMPTIFPNAAAAKENSMTRQQTPQVVKLHERQCHPNQNMDEHIPTPRNLAPMAHPH